MDGGIFGKKCSNTVTLLFESIKFVAEGADRFHQNSVLLYSQMYFFDEMDELAISTKLGIKPKQVSSLLSDTIKSMKEIFEDIIKHHRWQDVLCGTGSTMEFTAPLRKNLKSFLENYNVKSMLDAPCGDYSWMSITELPGEFKYIGADIVSDLITTNKEK